LAKREFTVRWLAQFELVVEAENEQQAVEKALDRLNEGESVDCFDFHAVGE
jgi:hypothetical protein